MRLHCQREFGGSRAAWEKRQQAAAVQGGLLAEQKRQQITHLLLCNRSLS